MNHSISTEYLNAIGREPMLTPKEELELARLVQAGRQPGATQRQVRLAERAKRRMILANMKLAVNLALKIRGRARSMEFVDLAQEAVFGLDRAAELFDPTRGYKFSTYAYAWVQQALTRSIANQDSMVRIPIHTREMLYRVNRAAEEAARLGQSLSMAQICERVNAVPGLTQAAVAVSSVGSLSAQRVDSDTELSELLPADERGPGYLDELGVDPDDLLRMVRELPDQQGVVIREAFGLDGASEVPQHVIGKSHGITRQAVADTKKKALNRLRRELLIQGVTP